MMTVVPVALGARSYDIVVGTGVLAESGARLAPLLRQPRVVVVTDATVAPLHLAPLRISLDAAGIGHDAVTVPAGESSKSWDGLRSLLDTLLDLGIERGATLVALGGGVVGDLTGLAASLALRGVDFVQVPTTLLAQVDSSVGGKTGIDTRHGKNLVGTFHQPRLVLADTAVLDTLPRRELLAGYAEVAKYGLLGDAEFFGWLETNGADVIAGDAAARVRAIAASCRAKALVVAEDEREAGRRALLNLGHTFGHALEAETGYGTSLLHGEAVAIGICLAFTLSVRLGLCPDADRARVRRHLAAIGLPTDLPDDARGWTGARLLAHMRHDKKVRDGHLTFVLARGIGDAFVSNDVPADAVAGLLDDAIAGAA